jgi:hypothetical protein
MKKKILYALVHNYQFANELGIKNHIIQVKKTQHFYKIVGGVIDFYEDEIMLFNNLDDAKKAQKLLVIL